MIEESSKTTLGHFFTKLGIDANVLIDLVLDPKAKDYFKEKGYSFPDKFLCTLSRIVGETKGVLINKYNFTEEKANNEIDNVLNELNIEKFPMIQFEDDVKIVKEIAKKFDLNKEDIAIIYCFWKLKVKKILVRDNAFEKTCKELNFGVIKWPLKF